MSGWTHVKPGGCGIQDKMVWKGEKKKKEKNTLRRKRIKIH